MTDRQQLLTEALESRILVLDGSMGQLLQLHMTVADYGGAHLENLTDYIVKTRPDVVAGIHRMYLEAGAVKDVFKHAERAGIGRSYRRTADQIAGNGEGISHAPAYHARPAMGQHRA